MDGVGYPYDLGNPHMMIEYHSWGYPIVKQPHLVEKGHNGQHPNNKPTGSRWAANEIRVWGLLGTDPSHPSPHRCFDIEKYADRVGHGFMIQQRQNLIQDAEKRMTGRYFRYATKCRYSLVVQHDNGKLPSFLLGNSREE